MILRKFNFWTLELWGGGGVGRLEILKGDSVLPSMEIQSSITVSECISCSLHGCNLRHLHGAESACEF